MDGQHGAPCPLGGVMSSGFVYGFGFGLHVLDTLFYCRAALRYSM